MINIIPFNFNDLTNLDHIDLLISAIGYESRASHLSTLLVHKNIKKKYCLKLVENCNPDELIKFKRMQFLFINDIRQFSEIFNDNNLLNVVIDYSVMSKSIYAEIIKLISAFEKLNNTKFYFSYTQSIYEKVYRIDTQIKNINLILSSDEKLMAFPRNGTKLVISLGHERLSAIGLIEYLEINYDDVIVLINKESSVAPYYKECINSNKDFLKLIDSSQIIEMNFFNFAQTITVLDSIYNRFISLNKFVILAPMSVKCFSLLSMIHSLNYNNVFFYNVTSLISSPSGAKLPDASIPPLIYQVVKNQEDSISIY